MTPQSFREEFEKAYRKRYNNEHPWLKTYRNIQQRTNLPETNRNYKNYKNIKNYLSPGDLRSLWVRDEAWKMDKPSIDRIDPKGNYTMQNCRYIELSENCGRVNRGLVKVRYYKTMICVECKKRKCICNFRSKGIKSYPHLKHTRCNDCLNARSEKFRKSLPVSELRARYRKYTKASYKKRQLAKELE